MKSTLVASQIPRDAEFGLFSLVHGDLLGGMIGRFAIRSPLYAVSLAAVLSFSAALVASFEGSLVNEDLNLDLLHDIGWWNQFLLAFPTLIYLTGSYFGEFPKTLRHLIDSGVLQADDKQWKTVRRFTHAKLMNTTFVLLPYVCAIAAAGLTMNVLQANGTWYDASRYIAGWLIPAHAFFLYFFMTYLALRLYTAFLILKMLFSFSVNIQPFHADGCGGLGGLMVQSEKLYWVMVTFGVVAALGILSNTFVYSLDLFSIYNIFLLLSYILLTGIAFFLPLYALSDRMREAKQRLLETIRQRYHALNRKRDSDDNELDKSSSSYRVDLAALKELRQTARSMQVWPFNSSSLVKFVCAATTPVIVIAVVLMLT